MDFCCEETETSEPQFCHTFLDTDYLSILDLVRALSYRWQEGKAELLDGALERTFAAYDAALEQLCLHAREACQEAPEDEDWIFLDLLYQLDDTLDMFFFKGTPYSDVTVFGWEIMKALRKQDFSECRFWNGLLRQNILVKHKSLLFREPKDPMIQAVLDRISDSHADDERTQIRNAYLLGYFLTDEIVFVVHDANVKPVLQSSMHSKNKVIVQKTEDVRTSVDLDITSIAQLTQYMKSLLDISYETFSEFCHTLIDYNDVLDVQLEAFLIACGKQNELLAWKNSLL